MSVPHAYVAVTNDLNQDQRMHRICGTLIEAGYLVTLVGRSKKDSKPLYDQKFDQKRLSLFFSSGVFFYLEYQLRLFVWLMFTSHPSLFFSVDLDTVLPIRLASLLRGTKCVHDAHELFTEVPELSKSPIKKFIWSLVGRLTMKGFDHRFTVNDSLAKILNGQYDCKFIAIRNLPLAKKESEKKVDFQRPYIWYQGVLNEGRGLEEMIEAMTYLPDLDFRLAGEGDKSHSLRLLAENSQAQDRIHFHGWMNSIEMHAWASSAWIGINLLDDKAANYYHSLANRTFDFVQADLPAIHMDFPEYRFVVEKYGVGVLISSLSIDLIVNTIKRIQKDKGNYLAMKRSCTEVKSILVWEFESEKMLDAIK